MELVKVNAEKHSLQESKAKEIEALYAPMVEMITAIEKDYNEIVSQEITPEVAKKAKRLRLDIAKIRVQADKKRKEYKDEYVRAGNAIQGAYNTFKFAVVSKEEKLLTIEKDEEIKEQARIDALQEVRANEMSKYEVEVIPGNLGSMEDEVWNNFITGTRVNYENKKEAERKAEEDRLEGIRIDKLGRSRQTELYNYIQFQDEIIDVLELGSMSDTDYISLTSKLKIKKVAYEKEQEAIKLENERLKKEADEKERLAKIEKQKRLDEEKKKEEERQRVENERLEKERLERERIQKENDDRLRKEREEQAKKQAIIDEQLKKEREDKEKAERELKEQKDKEERLKKEAEEAKQAELNKGDSAKLQDLLNDLENLKTKYSFKSKKNQKMYDDVNNLIGKVIDHINK